MEYLVMAASSKVFATVCTYPYQVVRARLQIQTDNATYKGVLETMSGVFRYSWRLTRSETKDFEDFTWAWASTLYVCCRGHALPLVFMKD